MIAKLVDFFYYHNAKPANNNLKIMKFRYLFLLIIFLIAPLQIFAQVGASDWYQVELIVFQNLKPGTLQSEVWPSHPPLPALNNAVDLNNTDLKDFQLLPSEDFHLKKADLALKQKGDYKVLLHLAWKQELQATGNAKPIHIYADPLNQANETESTTEPPYDPSIQWRLNGIIKLSRATLINMNCNLLLTVPVNELPAGTNIQTNRQIVSFRMMQKRRLKPNELHYFDHPAFGMLIKIFPLKSDEISNE